MLFLARSNIIIRRSSRRFVNSFSTQTPSSDSHLLIQDDKPAAATEEIHVLHQLSLLLPIRGHHPSSSHLKEKEKTLLMLVSPEDKLRGVFLQKLNGESAIQHSLTAAAASLDVHINSHLLARVVNSSLDGGSMVLVFQWAFDHQKVPHHVSTYNLLFKALGRRKFFNHMNNVLTQMRAKGVNLDNHTLFIFIDAFLKAKRLSKALHMFRNLEESLGLKYDLDSLKVMLRCLCHRSHVPAASALLNKMKHKVQCDGETYNIVIRGWSKFGRVNEIERLLNEMVEAGFDPDSFTFSCLLEGLGRNGRIDEAVKIFDRLKQQNVSMLNAAPIYNAMILNFISTGDIDECLKYYDAMLKNNCEPNIDTYVPIISALLKARRVADALELFDEMLARDVMPTTGTVTSFIESLCGYGPPHAAMMIYKKAKDVKCTISVNAYKILLMRLSRFGKCGMLLNIWDEMEQSGYVSDVQVYEYVINGLCNNGQLESAVAIMEDCLKKGFCPSRLISAKLNNKLLDSNKVEMAYKLFLKVKKSRRDENARKYWRAKGWHF